MLGMHWPRFFVINVLSSFAWAGAHIIPGILLTDWLRAMGLSLELVIIVGTLILTTLYALFHFHRQILLFLAPYLGGFGKGIEARLRKVDTPH